MWQKLIKEIAEIMADIKTGEIMSVFAGIYGVVFIAAALYYVSKGNILVAGMLLCFTPISFFVLATGTKLVLSRFTKDLDSLNSENKKSLPEVKLTVSRYVYPKYGTKQVGITIHNGEEYDLNDVYVKLVALIHQGFSDEAGMWVEEPRNISDHNLVFRSDENSTIKPNTATIFKLAEVKNGKAVLLLSTREYHLKPLYSNNQEKYAFAHGEWQLVFDVCGKTPAGVYFKKERFSTVVDSTVTKSILDSELGSTVTIDIKGDIDHI